MSRIVKKKSEVSNLPAIISLGVRDTDFLLRLIKRSTFDGTEIEQCNEVIQKLGELHRRNLEG